MNRTDEERLLWLETVEALSADYTNVYIANPDSNTVKPVKNNAIIKERLSITDDAELDYPALLGVYMKKRVHPDDREALLAALDMKALDSGLINKSEMTGTYRVVYDDGSLHTFQYKARRLSGGRRIILGFQNVDDAVAAEKTRSDQLDGMVDRLHRQLEMVTALSADYTYVFRVNMYNDTIETLKYRNHGEIIERPERTLDSYQRKMYEYVMGMVVPEDKERILNELSPSTVVEQFAVKDELTGTYRVQAPDGKYHNFRYKARKLGKHGELIVGFMNVDELVEQEKQRIAELQARIAEINALNERLSENERRLREAAEEREKQLLRITSLNERLQKTNDEMLEANAIIGGLSSEYHTICVINRDTQRTRLVRVSGKGTIPQAIDITHKYSDYWEATRRYIDAFVMPEDKNRCYEQLRPEAIFRHTDNSDELYTVNYLRRSPDGTVGYHQMAFVNASAGSIRRVIMGLRDVDEVVKAEQASRRELSEAREAAEAANKAKTSFLFNMSHDIRTPMNAILGFAGLLEKHMDEPERREDYLRKLQDSGAVLLSIINNVLEMARIEKGTIEIDEVTWSAAQLSDTMYSLLGGLMEDKNITFTREVNVQHKYILCDPIKLREIYLNILSNACKYTNPGGSVEMRVDELPCEREGWTVYRASIKDTGIGMSAEFLPHVFDEFTRESSTTMTGIEGTGLGMPIVKRLVELMHGTIEVKSEKGKGTEFIVTIPHKIAETADAAPGTGEAAGAEGIEGRRILLAEDNDLNAEIAMEVLESAGFEVERAEDGQVCLEMLTAAKPGWYDIILMDIQMPRMNGYEAARAVRKLEDPAKANIPILAMTANAFEEDRREALRSGMNGHAAKPINVKLLLGEIGKLLG